MFARVASRLTPQPLFGLVTALAAMAWIAGSWWNSALAVSPSTGVLAILLAAALALSYKYPVHIGRSTKVCMGSAALFLIAALLPLPVAGVAAGVGVLGGNWLVRAERCLYLSDIATDAGRWIMVVLLGSAVAHLGPNEPTIRAGVLILAGAVLWIGDLLTGPLLVYPMTKEPPWRIVRAMVAEGGVTEAYQYLLGLLGALAAMQQPLSILLLLVPIVPLHAAFKSNKEMQTSTREVLETMADAVDLRDPYTGGHSQRVAKYTAQILEAMDLFGPEVDLIVSAARVHDIGKIGTPDSILLKEGQLTPEERAVMEEHPARGAIVLERYKDFARGAAIIRGHHERMDGVGYPDGLKGMAIPFGARIIAVADSFDAMTSDRPYRQGMPVQRALSILRAEAGKQWDEAIVQVFCLSMTKETAPAESGNPRPVSRTVAQQSPLPSA